MLYPLSYEGSARQGVDPQGTGSGLGRVLVSGAGPLSVAERSCPMRASAHRGPDWFRTQSLRVIPGRPPTRGADACADPARTPGTASGAPSDTCPPSSPLPAGPVAYEAPCP